MLKIEKMKSLNKILISGFVLAVLFSFLGFNARSEDVSRSTLRLHVLANSDSEYDQRIKLRVKDDILALADSITSGANSIEEAQLLLTQGLEEIEIMANDTLINLGVDYNARAVVENTYFETREYDDFTLPAGKYKALRVFLGSGEGKNWWCVVYPSLCVSAASKDFASLGQGERELIESDRKVSFKLYEWYVELRNLFSGVE